MKGAPERIISRCTKILIEGQEHEFSDHHKKLIDEANLAFGKLGERVLAFARMDLDPKIYSKDPKNPY